MARHSPDLCRHRLPQCLVAIPRNLRLATLVASINLSHRPVHSRQAGHRHRQYSRTGEHYRQVDLRHSSRSSVGNGQQSECAEHQNAHHTASKARSTRAMARRQNRTGRPAWKPSFQSIDFENMESSVDAPKALELTGSWLRFHSSSSHPLRKSSPWIRLIYYIRIAKPVSYQAEFDWFISQAASTAFPANPPFHSSSPGTRKTSF
jgi:hypothetical protein